MDAWRLIRLAAPLLLAAATASSGVWSAQRAGAFAPGVASFGTLTLVRNGWGTPNSNTGLVSNSLLDYGPDENFFPNWSPRCRTSPMGASRRSPAMR